MRADQRSQLRVTFPRALSVDAPGLRFAFTKCAEAGDLKGIVVRAAMNGAYCVAEGPLPLASPHNAVDGITANVIFSERHPKGLQLRIVETRRGSFLPRQSDL